jgi:hypothetical protein
MDELAWRLAETIAWSATRAGANPATGWRTLDWTPPPLYGPISEPGQPHIGWNLAEREQIVAAVANARAARLRELGIYPPQPASSLAGGRLLFYLPDDNLFDGAARLESQGFFDVDNVPPWDLWLRSIPGETRHGSWGTFTLSCLISWVPAELLTLASAGVWANPEDCIGWLDEATAPTLIAFRARLPFR